MRVIGTAGHVDHGKSTLVRALTGIDPDRLKEEKKRQMTIDLGFAWYESPVAGSIGIVDVPGHRDFIENMLAGVGGIDAVLLVIAADEGIMPQTREHLAILDLLQIKTGLIVLSKTDMIEDPDWLELVELDIRDTLKGSVLENAPILRVSAITGEGLAELRLAIDEILASLGPRLNTGRARLPVDRVFSITGFGTVVTGTLVGGTFQIEDQIEILPSMLKGRVRGLHSHNKQETIAHPGSRTAMNIGGVEISAVNRGDTIAHPGVFLPTQRIDVRLQLVRDAQVAIRHNDTVKLFIASTETPARVRLLLKDRIEPGDWGWVQLETDQPVVADRNDRFIIRRLSPAQTIGGGFVVDPHPSHRHKLDDQRVTSRFESLTSFSKLDNLLAFIGDHPFINRVEILQGITEEPKVLNDMIRSLVMTEKVKQIVASNVKDEKYLEASYWQMMTKKVKEILRDYHSANPLKNGINREELIRRLRIPANEVADFFDTWKNEGNLVEKEGLVALPDFEIRYSVNQSKRLAEFLKIIDQDPYNPPNVKDARGILTDEVYQSLLDQSILIQLSPEVFIRSAEYSGMVEHVRAVCGLGVLLTLAEFRDHFSTSRKISQAFLEYLDRKKITEREGEGRRLR